MLLTLKSNDNIENCNIKNYNYSKNFNNNNNNDNSLRSLSSAGILYTESQVLVEPGMQNPKPKSKLLTSWIIIITICPKLYFTLFEGINMFLSIVSISISTMRKKYPWKLNMRIVFEIGRYGQNRTVIHGVWNRFPKPLEDIAH